MSGGSYNYVYSIISDIFLEHQDRDPRRAAFQNLLKLVAKAMHDIEWVDSCDYGNGDEHKSIDAVFAFLGNDPDVIKKAAAYDALKDNLKEFLK